MVMTALERKALLVLRRVRHGRVAQNLGVSRSHVTHVIEGSRRSPRIEAAIAALLDKPVDEVFGPPPATRKAA